MFSGKRLRLWQKRSSPAPAETESAKAVDGGKRRIRPAASNGSVDGRVEGRGVSDGEVNQRPLSDGNLQLVERLQRDYIKLEETVHSLMPYRNKAEVLETRLNSMERSYEKDRNKYRAAVDCLRAENIQLRAELDRIRSTCSRCSFCRRASQPSAASSPVRQSELREVNGLFRQSVSNRPRSVDSNCNSPTSPDADRSLLVEPVSPFGRPRQQISLADDAHARLLNATSAQAPPEVTDKRQPRTTASGRQGVEKSTRRNDEQTERFDEVDFVDELLERTETETRTIAPSDGYWFSSSRKARGTRKGDGYQRNGAGSHNISDSCESDVMPLGVKRFTPDKIHYSPPSTGEKNGPGDRLQRLITPSYDDNVGVVLEAPISECDQSSKALLRLPWQEKEQCVKTDKEADSSLSYDVENAQGDIEVVRDISKEDEQSQQVGAGFVSETQMVQDCSRTSPSSSKALSRASTVSINDILDMDASLSSSSSDFGTPENSLLNDYDFDVGHGDRKTINCVPDTVEQQKDPSSLTSPDVDLRLDRRGTTVADDFAGDAVRVSQTNQDERLPGEAEAQEGDQIARQTEAGPVVTESIQVGLESHRNAPSQVTAGCGGSGQTKKKKVPTATLR